jgi:hypothetical protein
VVKSIRGDWKCFRNSALRGCDSGSYYHTLEHEHSLPDVAFAAIWLAALPVSEVGKRALAGEEHLTNGFVWITVTHGDRVDGKCLAIQRIVSYRDYCADTCSALGFLRSGKRDH